jgi:protein TonB
MSMLRLPLYAPQGPSVARAGALSGAMTVNLLVLGALLLPAVVEVPLTQARPESPPLLVTRVVEAATAVVAPAPVEPQAARPPARPAPARPAAVSAPTPVPPSVGEALPLTPAAAVPGPADAPPVQVATSTASSEASLGYVDAPQPAYPAIALRKGWQGTVVLRVRVGTDGRPLAVEVARSSGHAVLDAAARRQVLARWRFQPAQRDGIAVEAVGLVPLAFSLDHG